MGKSLYLINAKAETPSYFGAEVFERSGLEPAHGIADLAAITVAALAPADWDVSVCDEYVTPVDFSSDADFIGITGKVNQADRMIEVAEEFRRRGKIVIMGGPFASLSPHALRGHCDILVIGELEGIAEQFFSDLENSEWKAEYTADRPDLALSPVPRWDLYPNDRTLMGCVQTSRGCPFECEFCDVIQYLGREQRHKAIDQIITELDVLYELGYRQVFLADDNFTVYRRRAKAVLRALRDWNESRPDGPVAFATQVSIDAARDPEIMQLCAEAGLVWVFIGIETPNEASLKETKKRQNVGINLIEQIQIFFDHGIMVTGGMIVGFDHDDLDIFQVQYDFAMKTPIPMFSLGALVAPAATPLFARMKAAGRLIEGGEEGTNLNTNIIPALMTREELLEGLRWLCNNLYSPESFGRRVVQMIERLGPQRGPFREREGRTTSAMRPVESETMIFLHKLIRQGPDETEMWRAIGKAMMAKPETGRLVMMSMYSYSQVRCLYEAGQFWEPHLADEVPLAGQITGLPLAKSTAQPSAAVGS